MQGYRRVPSISGTTGVEKPAVENSILSHFHFYGGPPVILEQLLRRPPEWLTGTIYAGSPGKSDTISGQNIGVKLANSEQLWSWGYSHDVLTMYWETRQSDWLGQFMPGPQKCQDHWGQNTGGRE